MTSYRYGNEGRVEVHGGPLCLLLDVVAKQGLTQGGRPPFIAQLRSHYADRGGRGSHRRWPREKADGSLHSLPRCIPAYSPDDAGNNISISRILAKNWVDEAEAARPRCCTKVGLNTAVSTRPRSWGMSMVYYHRGSRSSEPACVIAPVSWFGGGGGVLICWFP